MNLNLQGKVAVVTGAAAGIGREVARAFAREGVRVALVDIDAEGVHREAQTLSSEATPCLGLVGDVADRSRVFAMVAEAHAAFGRIDILFNNAGISTRCPMESLPEEDWDRVLAVNLKGTFLCIQAVLPLFRRQGSGAIVNSSSVVVKSGGNGQYAHYVASKAGIWGLTKHVARHAAAYGVRCNAVAPGTTETAFLRGLTPERRIRYGQEIPLGRIAQTDDIAPVVLFLASDAARYITGELVDVNGGMQMD